MNKLDHASFGPRVNSGLPGCSSVYRNDQHRGCSSPMMLDMVSRGCWFGEALPGQGASPRAEEHSRGLVATKETLPRRPIPSLVIEGLLRGYEDVQSRPRR